MKSAAVFLAEGFEEIEAVTPIDILRRAGVNVVSFSTSLPLTVTGSHSITITADDLIDNFACDNFDVIVLPGGQPGTQNLNNDNRVINAVKSFHSNQKLIAAICAAPSILLNAGVLGDTPVTSHLLKELKFSEFQGEGGSANLPLRGEKAQFVTINEKSQIVKVWTARSSPAADIGGGIRGEILKIPTLKDIGGKILRDFAQVVKAVFNGKIFGTGRNMVMEVVEAKAEVIECGKTL